MSCISRDSSLTGLNGSRAVLLYIIIHTHKSCGMCLLGCNVMCVCVCPAVWGYSVLSVTLISAFALTAVFVVPLMRTRFMRRTLIYFIALSIGTLFSTAILQLLPEVQYPSTQTHPNTPNQPWIKINLKVLSGIVTFFLLSSFTQCFLPFNTKHP